MPTRALFALSLTLALGCDPNTVSLVVDLRTDLVPGAEFMQVEVELDDGDTQRATVDLDATVATGVRIAEWSALPARSARPLRVRLLDSASATVVERSLVVEHTADLAVVVAATRSCRDVTCDSEQTCVGGRCQDPRCLTGAEASCDTPECGSDVECPAPADACARASCEAGICYQVSADFCWAGEFCDPDLGCREAPTAGDAGVATSPCAVAGDAAPLTVGPFAAGPPLRRSRVDFPAVTLGDDSVLFISGWEGAMNITNVDRYDPTSQTVVDAGHATYARSEHAAVFVAPLDWAIVAGGDVTGPEWTDGVERYDATEDAWTRMTALPEARFGHALTVDPECRIYVMGGACGSAPSCEGVWAMDPRVGDWSARAPVLTQRRGVAGAAGADGRIYVFGGSRAGSSGFLATTEVYLPTEDRWETRTSMRAPRGKAAAVTLPDGTILVVGGQDDAGPVATVERYDPATDTWSAAPSLGTARWGAGVALSGGEVIVAGGSTGDTYLDSTEIAPLR